MQLHWFVFSNTNMRHFSMHIFHDGDNRFGSPFQTDLRGRDGMMNFVLVYFYQSLGQWQTIVCVPVYR